MRQKFNAKRTADFRGPFSFEKRDTKAQAACSLGRFLSAHPMLQAAWAFVTYQGFCAC
jgi:hypothetical protein